MGKEWADRVLYYGHRSRLWKAFDFGFYLHVKRMVLSQREVGGLSRRRFYNDTLRGDGGARLLDDMVCECVHYLISLGAI